MEEVEVETSSNSPTANSCGSSVLNSSNTSSVATVVSPEDFPQRQVIVKRPENGLCYFCGQHVSASNWSRHLRRFHLLEIKVMRLSGKSPEEYSGKNESADNFVNGAKAAGIETVNSSTEKEQCEGVRMNSRTDTFDPDHLVSPKATNNNNVIEMNAQPENGRCQICNMRVTTRSWHLHLKRFHTPQPDDELTHSSGRPIRRKQPKRGGGSQNRIPAKSAGKLSWGKHVEYEPENDIENNQSNVHKAGTTINKRSLERATAALGEEEHDLENYEEDDDEENDEAAAPSSSKRRTSSLNSSGHLEVYQSKTKPGQHQILKKQASSAELDLLFVRLQTKLRYNKFPASVSVRVGPTAKSSPPVVAICAHFWCDKFQRLRSAGLELAPVPYKATAEQITDAVRNHLRAMELDGNVFSYTVNSRGVNDSARRAYFNPFPFIADAEDPEHKRSEVVESSSTALERFFKCGLHHQDFSDMFKYNDSTGVVFNPLEGYGDLRLGEERNTACAALTLEKVLKDVFERDTSMVRLRERIFFVLEGFAHSHSASTALFQLSRKTLLIPANTKWCTLKPVYQRLLTVSEHLPKVCEEYDFPTVFPEDMETIEKILEIASTFDKFSQKLQCAESPTASLLYPGLIHLLDVLKTFTHKSLPNIVTGLENAIRWRFATVLNSPDNAAFLCASILDPTVAVYLLADEQKSDAIAAVRTMADSLVKFRADLGAPPPASCRKDVDDEEVEEVESPFGFGTVKRTRRVGSQTFGAEDSSAKNRLDLEIGSYLAFISQLDDKNASASAIHFWTENEQKFPLLSFIAKTVLATPATSASVQKLFDQFSCYDVGKGSQIAMELRQRSLLHFNEDFRS